jgi:uncharacterized protein (TIGR03083 family)
VTPPAPTLSTEACLAAIDRHSRGLAAAARGHLDAPVQHCPGWTVADLVWHVANVHWFWGTIAAERLDAPPDESRRPSRPSDHELVDTFEEGARHLVEVLRAADQDARCWTWAPTQRNVGFITRHQVQEAAVHHWDAAHAAGESVDIERHVAGDAVDEFLTFSVSSDADPATATDDKPMPLPLNATFRLAARDTGRRWTVSDGSTPSTLRVEAGGSGPAPTLEATASDLLLWLYQRADLDPGDVSPEVIERFRGLCFTD